METIMTTQTLTQWINADVKVANDNMVAAKINSPEWIVANARKWALKNSLKALETAPDFKEWINKEIRKADRVNVDPKSEPGLAWNARLVALEDVYGVYKYGPEDREWSDEELMAAFEAAY